ncbi:hypothetical protein ACLVMU_05775 [Streptococcus pneumoniae]|uniref:Hyperosmolarity resistance protein Ebh n=1 Tax=Streptococcus pneumoniae TaxID=1313 RepID=A0A4J2A482_STREE|nr:hypothetical protein [Streptococcus pneumoniae]MBW7487957.1 hypothetical protein [Streptococcus pneumoniae]MBW7549060.1 hypothetical protein [Streptococcus pneumoniae]MBW8162079.1 hypothetical protein [Streptococcus pneumoniae]MBW8169739.1 hypothetical protein [Streptococcus pneumoniae]MDG8295404.1 hypothetical protein [Streptococcus pneumoniae]
MQILCYFTITVVAKPNNSGEVHLDVSIEDNQGGSGHNFSSVSSSSQTAKYEETGYNNNLSLYTTIDKTSDATALLKLKLNNVDNQPATEVLSSGITVKLNAKDNAGNWTSASNKKEITVKIVSAKPTYPDKILVKNPDNIKDTEKNAIIEKLKEANKNYPVGAPTFAKGEGEHANDIVATYSDGTTYYVPLNDVTKYAR